PDPPQTAIRTGPRRDHRRRVHSRRGHLLRPDPHPHRRRTRRHRPCSPRHEPAHGRGGWHGAAGRARLRHHPHQGLVVSSPQGRQAGSFGDELTNTLMIGLVALFGLALILRAAGSITAFLAGTRQPTSGPGAGVGVLFRPGDPGAALEAPGLNPVVYWVRTPLLLAVLGAGVGWVWMRLRRHTRQVELDPRPAAGVATRHDVQATASEAALLHRAGSLRPSLENPTAADVGYRLGTSKGRSVWASVEDSLLLIGPPRSGKGLHVVIPAILDAPGAVVTTSTRPDNLTATLRARE